MLDPTPRPTLIPSLQGHTVHAVALAPEHPRAAVLVLHGYAEHAGRYLHVQRALAARGYASVAPDHRGHGAHARCLGDLESLDAVLADLDAAVAHLGSHYPGLPRLLFGHSMGGMLALHVLARNPGAFAAAVVNGPGVEVPDSIPVFIQNLSLALGRVVPKLPVQPFFEPEGLSRDPAVHRDAIADPLFYKGRIRARTGAEILKGIRGVPAALAQIHAPVFVTHGASDTTVPVRAAHKVFEGLASADKALHLFEGLRHECHNEPEQADVIARWIDFFDAHLPAPAAASPGA